MKKNVLFLVELVFTIIFLSGCAGVKIYSDKNLQTETGLKYYHAKPFLLVERNSAKDVALKTSVVYLPDLAEAYYAKAIRGFGSNDLKLAFENASISSYGVVTDSKVPETITSLAGLLTGYGTTAKALAEAKQILTKSDAGEQAQSASIADLQKAKSELEKIKSTIEALIKETSDKSVISELQKGKFKDLESKVNSAIKIVSDLKPDEAEKAAVELEKAIKLTDEVKSKQETEAGKALNGNLEQLKSELSKVKQLLKPDVAPPVSFELYEIKYTSAGIQLKQVVLSK